MHKDTIQYLLEELPSLKKMFANYDAQTVSYDTIILLAVIVDRLYAIEKAIRECT